MFLPKGNNVWKGLKTFFIDVDKLLLFLKHEEFIGYIHVVVPGTQGAIYLQEGDAVAGVQEIKEGIRSGPETVKDILDLARRENNGSMSVVELPFKKAAMMAEAFGFGCHSLYENLSSDFSSLRKVMSKLENDGFTGFIVIHFQKEDKEAILFLEKGKSKAIFTDEMQMGLGEEAEIDLRPITSKIMEEVERAGALFDVLARD